MEKAEQMRPHVCGLFDVRGEKRTCIDRGAPYYTVAQIFRQINDFQTYKTAIDELIRTRYRYCRRHTQFRNTFQIFSST